MKLRIKELRDSRKWTIDQMAEVSGLSRGFISQLENDKRQPGPQTLLTLASTFDVPIAKLFDEDASVELMIAIQMFEAIKPEDRKSALRALSGFVPSAEAS